MNLGGHIAVATVASPDPVFWLGSALPDVAAMGRFRLLGQTEDPVLAAGIAFHHTTDDAFHRHPWFTALQRELYLALTTDGMSRGAARAVAHVGPELLLDGALLGAGSAAQPIGGHRQLGGQPLGLREAQGAALDCIAATRSATGPLVDAEHTEPWLFHLGRVAEHGMPTDYNDPAAVAHRLQRILARRPRLAFDRQQIATVTGHLESIHPHIDQTCSGLIAELATALV